MNPGDIAPVIGGVTFMIVTGVVILFRPFMKQLASYLGALAEEKRRTVAAPAADNDRIATLLERLDDRITRLEERQQFTDQLLSARERRNLTEGAGRE